ncbi:MAG: hypothetical protein WD045_02700 [Pirellulaceae bacterium]
MSYRTLSCQLFIGLLLLSGCGEPGSDREAVSGAVTLDGKPLETGSIQFTPEGSGSTASGEIENGQYNLQRESGLSPGSYRVQIQSWRPAGKAIRDEATGTTEQNLVSIIPPRYNERSELKANIEKDAKNEFDFTLQSK